MDLKVFRTPSGQDYDNHWVQKVNDQKGQKKKKDDEQQKKKKKNEQMEDIFSSLAESLSRENEET